jgi:hypothetical protein
MRVETDVAALKFSDGSQSSFRTRRFGSILKTINEIISRQGTCDIIDVGGEFGYWKPFLPQLDGLPIKILICNLDDKTERFSDGRFSYQYADACNLSMFADKSFDLAHSNSVIEHVGHWKEMAAMASEIRRVAKHYYVQTPYYWFPVEPHFRFIGYQWLPEQWRARLHMRREMGFFPMATKFSDAMLWTQSAVLLDVKQLKTLFPDAAIEREKFFFFTKSIMATSSTG